jgi:lipid-A-disaccharide synthase
VLIADRDATIAAADEHGLFLIGQKLARDQDVYQRTSTPALRPLKLFLIAGEHSGDALGAKLIEALRAGRQDRSNFKVSVAS